MKDAKDKQFSTKNQSKITEYLMNPRIKTSNTNPTITINPPTSHRPLLQKKENNQAESSNRSRSSHSHASNGSSLSAASNSPLIIQRKEPQKPTSSESVMLNVEFYLNKMPSKPCGEFIDKIHKEWSKDYDRLERDHSFIQWLFPNSFQSRFNMHARPLSLEEAEIFKGSAEMLERYVRSYEMMLGFYGIKLKSKQTGEVARSRLPDYKDRFYKTLLTSFHNHMRITRILCSLTELGFSAYASELCKFLKRQIESGELMRLAKYNVYNEWKPFQTDPASEKNTNVFMASVTKGTRINTKTLKPKEDGQVLQKEERAPSCEAKEE